MKIYIVGSNYGVYRCQNVIKALMDLHYSVCYIDHNYIAFNRLPLYIIPFFNLITRIVILPFKIFLILQSTCLYILPLNKGIDNIIEMLIGKVFFKPIIGDFYISGYDTWINDRKKFDPNSINGKLFLIVDRLYIFLCNYIIFLNNSEANYYLNLLKMQHFYHKVKLCPLVSDFKSLIKFNKSKYNYEFNQQKPFIVCWWGNYIPLHGLEKIIRAFAYLRDHPIKLYIFGKDLHKSLPYQAMVEELNLQNTITIRNDLTFANFELIDFLTSNCHLSLGSFGDSLKAKTVMLNKIIDSFALKIPCLTMNTHAIDELIPEKTLFICESSSEEISNTICKILLDRNSLSNLSSKGYEVYLNKFSQVAFLNNIKAIFEDIF